MAEVGRLSASKITTYEGCSLAYYLKYIAHEKVPENIRLAFGKASHYMLNKFYKVNFKSAESFANFWKHYWDSVVAGDFLKGKAKDELKVLEFVQPNDFVVRIGSHLDMGANPLGSYWGYRKLGANILSQFYQKHKNRQPPLYREKSFGKRKDDIIKINEHLVTGVFDRIDEYQEEFYITDYKTDKASPASDSFILHRHPQFTLYSYVFREIFKKPEKAILYYHLREGKRYETHRSEADYEYLKKLLDEVAEGITNDRFVPFYGVHCSFCDYKTACEKYAISHHGGPRIDLEGKIKPAKEFQEWDAEAPTWIEIMAEER